MSCCFNREPCHCIRTFFCLNFLLFASILTVLVLLMLCAFHAPIPPWSDFQFCTFLTVLFHMSPHEPFCVERFAFCVDAFCHQRLLISNEPCTWVWFQLPVVTESVCKLVFKSSTLEMRRKVRACCDRCGRLIASPRTVFKPTPNKALVAACSRHKLAV